MTGKAMLILAALWVALVVGGLWYRTTTNAARQAQCPAGAVYSWRVDACIPGSRPWEGE